MKFRSIADRIDETGGHASGFDYLRLLLSLSIVCLHSGVTAYGFHTDQDIFQSWARPLVRLILPAFFALSGFLVAGSLERCKTLAMFLGLRVLRIYPALTMEVLLSAFLLGPIVSTTATASYFGNSKFFSYLCNAVGDIHYSLPGVFLTNPLPNTVNGQLWTIPFELGCYITLATLALLGLRRHRIIGPIGIIAVTTAYLITTLARHHHTVIAVPGAINGALLIATFLAGVSLYLYRDKLPYNHTTGLIALATSAACLGFLPLGDFIAPIPAAYLTIYLGLQNPTRKWLRGADYSYGIFLYGFIIQQTLVYLIPAAHDWRYNILLSVPSVTLVAAFSWHAVEKPAQRFRSVMKGWENAYLAKRQPAPPAPKPDAEPLKGGEAI